MTKVTKEELELVNARANAIFCPKCRSIKTRWNFGGEWNRICLECGHKWVDERLRALLEK